MISSEISQNYPFALRPSLLQNLNDPMLSINSDVLSVLENLGGVVDVHDGGDAVFSGDDRPMRKLSADFSDKESV